MGNSLSLAGEVAQNNQRCGEVRKEVGKLVKIHAWMMAYLQGQERDHQLQ
jgi:hypothetical protein